MTERYKTDVGQAIQNVAKALHALGVGNAATDMGAIESHSMVMKDALREHGSAISEGLSEVASALFDVADAIRESKSESDAQRGGKPQTTAATK